MTAVPASLCCTVLLFSCVFADQKTITAEPGETITLPCRAPNNNLIVVDWSRTDLDPEYIFLYWDGHFHADNQHPSFKNRVDLQDRQMKDGDVSVILKNVTINDTGTYECRVAQRRTNREKRALLKTYPISIIYLRVVAPPGPSGGTTEDGGKEDGGVSRGRPGLAAGLSVFGVICVVVVFVISGKLKKKNSPLPSLEQQSV